MGKSKQETCEAALQQVEELFNHPDRILMSPEVLRTISLEKLQSEVNRLNAHWQQYGSKLSKLSILEDFDSSAPMSPEGYGWSSFAVQGRTYYYLLEAIV